MRYCVKMRVLSSVVSDVDLPLLRCRIKDFKQFVNTVKDIRSTIAYYRVYDSLFEIDSDEASLSVNANDLKLSTAKKLGFAKVKWNKRYFCVINGILYMFKEDVYIMNNGESMLTALKAWDLQIIDCVLDDNGKRSGSKFCCLIINGAKTYFLKFQSGPDAIIFYSKVKQCWTETRGKYYVDFSSNPPEISGEANGPQPILKNDSLSLSLKKKSSYYMPNPANGGTMSSPKEQDALILNLIREYELKQELKNKRDTAAALHLASELTDDLSSSVSFDIDDNGDNEDDDSGILEGSEDDESDDPLYRQVSQMTSRERLESQQLANQLAQKHNLQAYLTPNNDDEDDECILKGNTTTRMPPPPARKNVNVVSLDEPQQQNTQEKEESDGDDDVTTQNKENEETINDSVSAKTTQQNDQLIVNQQDVVSIELNGYHQENQSISPETMKHSEEHNVNQQDVVELNGYHKENEEVSETAASELKPIGNNENKHITNEYHQNEQMEMHQKEEPNSLNIELEENEQRIIDYIPSDYKMQSMIDKQSNQIEEENVSGQIEQNNLIKTSDDNITSETQQIEQHNEFEPASDRYPGTMTENEQEYPSNDHQTKIEIMTEEKEESENAIPSIEKIESLTPKPSQTMQTVDNIAVAPENECNVSPISVIKPPENTSSKLSAEAISEPKQCDSESKETELRKKPRTLSNVSAKIEKFNKKNETLTQRHGSPKNGTYGQTQMLSPKSPNHRKRKRRRKKKTKSVVPVASTMSHLKLTRWFKLDRKQLAKLHSPSFESSLQKQLEKWGILSLDKNKKHIKVQISRRIPLPKRQSHWNTLIEALQTKLGESSLLKSETVVE